MATGRKIYSSYIINRGLTTLSATFPSPAPAMLGQQLGADVTKTSAVAINQSASLGQGFGVGLG
jgi:hypothetical protein